MATYQKVSFTDASGRLYVFTQYAWNTELRAFDVDLVNSNDSNTAPMVLVVHEDSVTMPTFGRFRKASYEVLPGWDNGSAFTVKLSGVSNKRHVEYDRSGNTTLVSA
jgi:hypothetical protein